MAAFTALASFSVIPFGDTWEIGGYDVSGRVVDVSIGLLLLFSLGAVGTTQMTEPWQLFSEGMPQ